MPSGILRPLNKQSSLWGAAVYETESIEIAKLHKKLQSAVHLHNSLRAEPDLANKAGKPKSGIRNIIGNDSSYGLEQLGQLWHHDQRR